MRGDISSLLLEEPGVEVEGVNFELNTLISYLESGDVPTDSKELQKVATQALHFAVVDGILYFIDEKASTRKRVVVPSHLREKILEESHRGKYAGHFLGGKLYSAVS